MNKQEMARVIVEIAKDIPNRFGGQRWSAEQRQTLLNDLTRVNLQPTEEQMWTAYHRACERGGAFPPPVNTFVADVRYAIRNDHMWNHGISAGRAVLPQPQTSDSAAALKAYLDGIHADSLHEAVEIEAEAKRRGVWNDPATGATGNYDAYGWVPEWKASRTKEAEHA